LWRHHGVGRTVVVSFDYGSLALLELLRRQVVEPDRIAPTIVAAFMVNGGLFADAHSHPWQGTPMLRSPLGALGARGSRRSPASFIREWKRARMYSRDYHPSQTELVELWSALVRHPELLAGAHRWSDRDHGLARAARGAAGCQEPSFTHRGDGMNDTAIPSQYVTRTSRPDIEQALVAAGKDLDRLQVADLAMMEDYHTGGRIATGQLVDLVDLSPDSEVLDAGTGIGGTARYLAARFGCAVAAVDLSDEYCETARWLNRLVGLDDRIVVRRGDVTTLPFDDSSFDVVFSQHVQMNVAGKDGLYQEARRVLKDGGQLALWDITAGNGRELDYPLPWADVPDQSHLSTPVALRAAIEAAGFTVKHWRDLTEEVGTMMRTMGSLPPSPLGLHAFVPNFRERVKNLSEALSDGRLQAIQAVVLAR
jgi:ubiquinone/menaquinone biosynthesis C-methylase UbiE